MEGFVGTLTRGTVTEVKVILASVALSPAVYQLVLIAVGYGKVRPHILGSRAASFAHRAGGDVIAVLLVVVAVMCISYSGLEESALHAAAGSALLVVLALKMALVRRRHAPGRFLPRLGTTSTAGPELREEGLEQLEERREERDERLDEVREQR